MKRRDIQVGMAVDHRLGGGQRGKHLGIVTAVGAVVVSYRRPDGGRGIATPAELMPADQERRTDDH